MEQDGQICPRFVHQQSRVALLVRIRTVSCPTPGEPRDFLRRCRWVLVYD